MTKKDKLEEYARKEFDVELDKRLSLKKLESQVKKLEDEQVIESEEFIADLVYPEIKPEVVKETITEDWWFGSNPAVHKMLIKSNDQRLIDRVIGFGWLKEYKEQ